MHSVDRILMGESVDGVLSESPRVGRLPDCSIGIGPRGATKKLKKWVPPFEPNEDDSLYLTTFALPSGHRFPVWVWTTDDTNWEMEWTIGGGKSAYTGQSKSVEDLEDRVAKATGGRRIFEWFPAKHRFGYGEWLKWWLRRSGERLDQVGCPEE